MGLFYFTGKDQDVEKENCDERRKHQEKLQVILSETTEKIQAADALEKLNDVRVNVLGKKGQLTAVLKGMKDVAPEDRPKVGQLVNEVREKIEVLLEESKSTMEKALMEKKLAEEVIDVTLPAKKADVGHRHPNTIALEEVERIFIGMGYEVVERQDAEYQDYNFTKLNIPEGHPARDEQDTFFIDDKICLRSQTSPVQARTMEKGKLPIRMIAPGRVFRSDEVDATHSPSFHQIEESGDEPAYHFCGSERNSGGICRELFGRRQRQNSVRIISRSQSLQRKWMSAALNAAEKDVVSVKVPAGSKSWDAVWYIRTCWRCAALIRKNIQVLLSEWGWSVLRF